jgi:hypothetical protein
MECQLRPLLYSLDLNNSPRIRFTPGKSQSFAKFRAQMCTAEWQRLKTVARFVAFRGKFKGGNVRSVAFRGQILPRSWHSAVSWRVVVGIPQYVSAECQGLKTVARFVAFRGNWRAECQQRLNSSTHHFTSTTQTTQEWPLLIHHLVTLSL